MYPYIFKILTMPLSYYYYFSLSFSLFFHVCFLASFFFFLFLPLPLFSVCLFFLSLFFLFLYADLVLSLSETVFVSLHPLSYFSIFFYAYRFSISVPVHRRLPLCTIHLCFSGACARCLCLSFYLTPSSCPMPSLLYSALSSL